MAPKPPGRPPLPYPELRQSRNVSVRFSPGDFERIAILLRGRRDEGITVSAFVRECTLRAIAAAETRAREVAQATRPREMGPR